RPEGPRAPEGNVLTTAGRQSPPDDMKLAVAHPVARHVARLTIAGPRIKRAALIGPLFGAVAAADGCPVLRVHGVWRSRHGPPVLCAASGAGRAARLIAIIRIDRHAAAVDHDARGRWRCGDCGGCSGCLVARTVIAGSAGGHSRCDGGDRYN